MDKEKTNKAIITHTEMVQYCTISGDPGCLGWPDWHYQDCIYVEEARLFCRCGGNDVYGEMWHEENCPLYEVEQVEIGKCLT